MASIQHWKKNGFKKLCEYTKEFGTSAVPDGYVAADGFKLGNWVHNLRRGYKKNRNLTPEFVKSIEKLPGWFWKLESSFMRHFQHLVDYEREYGNTLVTSNHRCENGFTLGNWVGKIRSQYKQKALTNQQITDLENLSGWVWDIADNQFQEWIDLLSEYSVEHGNLDIVARYKSPAGDNLGLWVHRIRTKYVDGKLPQNQVEALEALPGWKW